jgi:hypothetical protein
MTQDNKAADLLSASNILVCMEDCLSETGAPVGGPWVLRLEQQSHSSTPAISSQRPTAHVRKVTLRTRIRSNRQASVSYLLERVSARTVVCSFRVPESR